MKIEEIKRKYGGKWLAIKVTKREGGKSIEGELLAIADDREEILDKLEIGEEPIYVLFAGPPIKEGYVACFVVK